MSYLEIYNENIRDLLDTSSGYLELRDESGGRNIQVTLDTLFYSTKIELIHFIPRNKILYQNLLRYLVFDCKLEYLLKMCRNDDLLLGGRSE